jgi:hypothetical protein
MNVIELVGIMACHYKYKDWCIGCLRAFGDAQAEWPCQTYRLAKHASEQSAALEIEKAKVARGMALAERLRRNGAGDRAIWIEAALTEQVQHA